MRDELTKISKISDENECSEKLEQLKKTYNHMISTVHSQIPLSDFNCFEYALELSKLDKYMEMKKKFHNSRFGNIFCNSYFIQWLIDKNLLHRDDEGDLILYQSICHEVFHAGIVIDDMIVSKWDSGCIYKHPWLEIPTEYRTMPQRYSKPDANDISRYFRDYLNELASIIKELNGNT